MLIIVIRVGKCVTVVGLIPAQMSRIGPSERDLVCLSARNAGQKGVGKPNVIILMIFHKFKTRGAGHTRHNNRTAGPAGENGAKRGGYSNRKYPKILFKT